MSKKQKTLNPLTKSLMIANDYKYVDAAHAKDFIKSMKEEYSELPRMFCEQNTTWLPGTGGGV